MRLFGGLLPFIGFRNEPIDEELRMYLDLPEDQKHISTFQIEWLGVGISFVRGAAKLPD